MGGIGGDNPNFAIGTFFEGAITTGYTTDAIDDAVQANIVGAGYISHDPIQPDACSNIEGLWNAYSHGLCRIGTNAFIDDGCTWSMVCADSGFWQGGTVKGTKVSSTANDDIHTVWTGDFTDDDTISWSGNLWTRAEENAG